MKILVIRELFCTFKTVNEVVGHVMLLPHLQEVENNIQIYCFPPIYLYIYNISVLRDEQDGSEAFIHDGFIFPLTFALSRHFHTFYCSESRLSVKACPKVSSSFCNKALVGGFPRSHCGFRAVGCHYHLRFHHVGVTKPSEILPVNKSHTNRPYFLE